MIQLTSAREILQGTAECHPYWCRPTKSLSEPQALTPPADDARQHPAICVSNGAGLNRGDGQIHLHFQDRPTGFLLRGRPGTRKEDWPVHGGRSSTPTQWHAPVPD